MDPPATVVPNFGHQSSQHTAQVKDNHGDIFADPVTMVATPDNQPQHRGRADDNLDNPMDPPATMVPNFAQADSVPPNPPERTTLQPQTDTGWAWVVLVGSVVVNFVALGASSSLSVYLNVWMEHFDATAVTVGFVLSSRTLVKGILGPVSAMICTKCGPRVTMMMGGVTLVGGYVIATFSPTVGILIFSNGLTALGASLSKVASFQTLSVYFKKRFTFAVGLASVGVSVKQLVFPPLYTYLIDLYGWQGSMLIIAGVSFHVVAAGALMRPITFRKTNLGPDVATDNSSCNTTTAPHGERPNIFPALDSRLTNSTGKTEERRVKNCSGGQADGVTIDSDSDTKSPFRYVKRHLSGFKHFMLETYGLRRLANNTEFIILMIVSICHGFGKLGLVYSVPRAESVGIEPTLAPLILSLIGGGSAVAVVTHGWFIDKKYITAEMAYALGVLLNGAFVALTPAFVTFVPLAIIAVPMGMVSGMTGPLLSIIVCSHVQKTDTVAAFGTQLFFWGIGDIAGIFMTGLVYDNLGSYDVAFFIGGGALLFAAMLTFVIYVTKRRKQRRKEIATVENWTDPVDFQTNQSAADLSGSVPQSEESGFSNPAYVPTGDDSLVAVELVFLRFERSGDRGTVRPCHCPITSSRLKAPPNSDRRLC